MNPIIQKLDELVQTAKSVGPIIREVDTSFKENRHRITTTVEGSYLVQELVRDYPKLRQQILAYERFVEAVEGRGSTWCDGKHHENINGACAQDVEDQINKALATLKKESL